VTHASSSMTFFGVDPGTRVTGYGVVSVVNNTVEWVDSGVLRARAGAQLPEKLAGIYDGLSEKIARHSPRCVCVEQAFYGKNARTALVLGLARGVALLAARKSGVNVVEYSPLEIKKSVVGSGRATKEQVSYMVHMLLHPPQESAQEDACDALAAALCAFYHHKAGEVLATGR